MRTIFLFFLVLTISHMHATINGMTAQESEAQAEKQPLLAPEESENPECAICLRGLYDCDKNGHMLDDVVSLRCSEHHTFHAGCLVQHYNARRDAATCPSCRHAMLSISGERLFDSVTLKQNQNVPERKRTRRWSEIVSYWLSCCGEPDVFMEPESTINR